MHGHYRQGPSSLTAALESGGAPVEPGEARMEPGIAPVHYAEVDKFGLKWSTLTSHFSAHFCTKGAKFLTGMSELPKNLKKLTIEN